MIRNYFKIAIRNLRRHASFSAINIAGLTLGLTACLLIGLFVWDEKQYDKSIPDGDKVFRIYNERMEPGEVSKYANTPPMFSTALKSEFPEVKNSFRIMMTNPKRLFEVGDKKIYEENSLYTEEGFFEMFPLPMKYGSSKKVLEDPKSIVISEELSKKYFGDINPVNKDIMIDKENYRVKGVLQKVSKFHLSFNYILPFSSFSLPKERMESWQWQQFFTYFSIKDNADPARLEKKFQDLIVKKAHPITKEGGFTYMPFIQPLHDIHLYSSSFKYDNAVKGNITYVKALTIIAIFILLIACFNFINLATAKSLQRAKEVGVRKSIGASRQQLMLQFTGETVVLTIISILISIGLVVLLLPKLNEFTSKEISLQLFANPLLLLLLFASALLVGLLAGFYPALVLSGFQPIKVLKSSIGGNAGAGKGQWLRKGLVVIQFALSALLIISAIVVYQQVNYLHNKNLGFNKEQIMFFPMRGDKMFNDFRTFKTELKQSPSISSVSIGYGFPGDAVAGDEIIIIKDGQQVTQSVTQLMVDEDYISTLGLQMIAGRDFSRDIRTDKDEAFIINETAVKELGFGTAEKAIGKPLMWHPWGASNPDSLKKGRVIGIVKDFHFKSLYDKVGSAVLQIFPDAAWKVAVKMKSADLGNALAHVKTTWTKFSTEFPIEYKFLDENFEVMYTSEDKLRSLLWIFTAIAVFVGCLGLFGLAAYAAERRTKEIGIRKVLGASVNGIVLLLSKDFLRLVLVALIVASPIAWYFMNKWLQDFAYRINISWWVFALAGGVALFIALLTVSFQAIRAALTNPVKSLRTE